MRARITARRRSSDGLARCHCCAFQSHQKGAASNGYADVDDSAGACSTASG